MICPNCGYKNPNGLTEHDRCRSCRQVMTAPVVEEKPKMAKTAKKAKTTKKA